MATFPLLQSGAICQHPAQVTYQQAVQILRYIDGSDQRFLQQGRQLRQWEVRLDLLNEIELLALETSFRAQLGDYLPFDFLDPFTDTVVPQCVIGNSSMVTELLEGRRCTTSLWVVETRA